MLTTTTSAACGRACGRARRSRLAASGSGRRRGTRRCRRSPPAARASDGAQSSSATSPVAGRRRPTRRSARCRPGSSGPCRRARARPARPRRRRAPRGPAAGRRSCCAPSARPSERHRHVLARGTAGPSPRAGPAAPSSPWRRPPCLRSMADRSPARDSRASCRCRCRPARRRAAALDRRRRRLGHLPLARAVLGAGERRGDRGERRVGGHRCAPSARLTRRARSRRRARRRRTPATSAR